jgi:hypothetical protein
LICVGGISKKLPGFYTIDKDGSIAVVRPKNFDYGDQQETARISALVQFMPKSELQGTTRWEKIQTFMMSQSKMQTGKSVNKQQQLLTSKDSVNDNDELPIFGGDEGMLSQMDFEKDLPNDKFMESSKVKQSMAL